MAIKIQDFELKNVSIKNDWVITKANDDTLTGTNINNSYQYTKALVIYPFRFLKNGVVTLSEYKHFNISTLTDYNHRGSIRYDYDNRYLNTNGKPTLEEFNIFFGGNSIYSDTWVRNIANDLGGFTPAEADSFSENVFTISGGVPVFFPQSLSTDMTSDDGRVHITINTDGDLYVYNDYLMTVYPTVLNVPEYMQLPSSVKHIESKYTHYLYVNGGKLGKGDNYTITEVIESSEENSIKWVDNSKSKLKCFKGDLASSMDDNWETGMSDKKLDTSRDTAFSKIMSANSVSTIQQNVAYNTNSIIPYPFFTYELIPTFLKNGSQFTGNRYNITFPKNLPSSADGVNNAWANVSMLGDKTDANNDVIVLYGEPPTAQTPDEQQREDSLSDKSENTGENSGDSDSKKPSSTDITWGSDVGSANELTKLYAISSTQLKLLGEKLWSQSYMDVLKIQDNPIENIISLKKFPFTISGTEESVKIGNVDLGVNAEKIGKGTHSIIFGDVVVKGKYKNFLDFEPFTSLKICLPYIGIYDLPISEIMNKRLNVKYIIDLIHGDCIAIVNIDGYAMYEFNGNMGVNIPITQTDRVSAETKHMQNVASSIVGGFQNGSVASGLVGISNSLIESGLSSYNVSHTASGSGAVNLANVQNVRLIYNRPQTILKSDKGEFVTYPYRYGHTHGYPYNNAISIDKLSGFFKCGDNIDLSTIKATKDIKDKIIEMLKGGVYK